MAQLTHQQYDQLERAVLDGTRISVYRRGTEYIVVPLRIGLRGADEIIEARNPTTGDEITLKLGEIDSIDFVR
jgi:hypothetical protein